jgi:hypothetical protein
MPAHEHVHPLQFKLFMGGQEWQQSVSDSVDRPFVKGQKMSNLWKEKLTESKEPDWMGTHGAGVHESLSRWGYDHEPDDPPTILVGDKNRQTQGEGHHRIAAAADIERTTGRNIWIPTNYMGRNGGYD